MGRIAGTALISFCFDFAHYKEIVLQVMDVAVNLQEIRMQLCSRWRGERGCGGYALSSGCYKSQEVGSHYIMKMRMSLNSDPGAVRFS